MVWSRKIAVVNHSHLSMPQIWKCLLALATIVSHQGSATCCQIALVKNISSTIRSSGYAAAATRNCIHNSTWLATRRHWSCNVVSLKI
ncbi:hypothetical protein MCOR07_005914 [Pyricularia oryzae]|uniref:Uncharacterized protein n=4 Tax=Pyricularia oryzae TaxID=318829 RepID=G4NFL1_PYRO7|nr:uncharacterized protein MGG_14141 [Pyricularia oryzae 70-15]ELQ33660.1 hypothetical protein OOU_Y34scaffold00912g2 [Pyricularia oryzae Y34]KAI6289882.1 hypothetical protein MCOR34_010598 [Pyricularia oryzae]EHA46818.1 hypothetical protein MGG_14141 [Pyricularia oryzae 70-15]KAI6557254.1 hypothetical protein MCOR04_010144 [Pyricularia oryzae]KAI6596922.1 hypothetical protein MCOR12_005919 [Pyricularia oryzae]